jgi:transcriptional regulator with XRE-family HTH domain
MKLRADRLVALRKARGWSQRELARRSGFGFAVLQKYEAGESDPSSTYLALMADQLEVSTDYLLGRSDDLAGQVLKINLSFEEERILEAFRRQRWVGLMRLLEKQLTDKLPDDLSDESHDEDTSTDDDQPE